MNQSTLKSDLMTRLESLVKPVSSQDVRSTAAEVLKGVEYSQFMDWLDSNETYLLQRLNA